MSKTPGEQPKQAFPGLFSSDEDTGSGESAAPAQLATVLVEPRATPTSNSARRATKRAKRAEPPPSSQSSSEAPSEPPSQPTSPPPVSQPVQPRTVEVGVNTRMDDIEYMHREINSLNKSVGSLKAESLETQGKVQSVSYELSKAFRDIAQLRLELDLERGTRTREQQNIEVRMLGIENRFSAGGVAVVVPSVAGPSGAGPVAKKPRLEPPKPPGPRKCYCCGEPGHRIVGCSQHRKAGHKCKYSKKDPKPQ
jgi:hypothetical protein